MGTERPHGQPPPYHPLYKLPWYRHPWVITLAGLLVGGMVGIYGSGPDPTAAPATVTVTSLTASSGSLSACNPSEAEVMPMMEQASEKRGPEDNVLGRRRRLSTQKR
jgi:hypothetical protein